MSPLRSGLAAALRHRRLALSLWLSLLATALLAWPAIQTATEVLDESPYRESIVRGWDSWAMLTWIGVRVEENAAALAVLPFVVLVSVLLQLALTGGLLRVLIADVNRPVLGRLVSESAALFRPTLWAFSRYLLTLVFWEGLLVAAPVAILRKVAGEDAVPHGPFSELTFWWALLGGTLVFFAVGVRFDLARIALARGDAPTARGAYRVAKLRLHGSRFRAVGLAVFWMGIGLVVQAVFTNAGVRMNPQSDGGTFGLFLFRQLGFVVLAAVRVAYWGSFLAFEARRRPRAFVPLGHPDVIAPLPIPSLGPLRPPATEPFGSAPAPGIASPPSEAAGEAPPADADGSAGPAALDRAAPERAAPAEPEPDPFPQASPLPEEKPPR